MRLPFQITPAVRLAFSITLLVLSIVSIATALGLVPDSNALRLEARSRIAEALTVQLATAASRNNIEIITNTIEVVRLRDAQVRSIAMRRTDGEVVAASPGHADLWKDANPARSTSTHVRVPVSDGSQTWGDVEIVFTPIDKGFGVLGIPSDLLLFALFMGVASFAGVFGILTFALRQLDPTRSVPTRVQNAFDSLADGIAVIDEKENILLVNHSLASILGADAESFVGKNLGGLLWRHWNKEAKKTEFPWSSALREQRTVRDVSMNLRTGSGNIVNVLVNASCISADDQKVSGALVTFKDVTVLERKNMDLSLAYSRLQQSETEVKKQNNQLKYLASHDPLTSCMNRRSLFEEFEKKYQASLASGKPLTCLMIDIDHFKKVNDTYGHATGDDVIAGLAQLLRRTCREQDLVGRYGGEEFCMVLDGLDVDGAAQVAERLRLEVKRHSPAWLQRDKELSISIGIAAADKEAGTIGKAVDNADQALYAAKKGGRDKAVLWRRGEPAEADRTLGVQAEAARKQPAGDAEQPASIAQFLDRLGKSMRQAKQEKNAVAVICVNIDSLQEYEDAFGPRVSAAIVNAVEARLNAIFGDADTVSLMSGKERTVSLVNFQKSRFLVEFAQIADSTSVSWILERLAEKLAAPLRAAELTTPLRFSIGASLYPHDGLNASEVAQNAILAQKKASEIGGDKAIRMFSSDMFEMAQEQLRVERGIRDAIDHNEFQLHFQPIVDLIEGRAIGAEVLLRSTNKDLVNTSIDAVIQIAEKTGLIHDLSNFVFESTFETINRWKRSGVQPPMISINISAKQLQSKDVVFSLLKLVEAYGVEPSTIQLEMTETAMVTDLDRTSEILHALQNCGFHIALDDFGTGGSSLSHLLEIKPDAIKIDKSFIQSLTKSHTNSILVTTITELSRKIGAKVVAEGVETTEQLDKLMQIGCRHVQGYLFSKPLPADDFRKWMLGGAGVGAPARPASQPARQPGRAA